MRRCRLNNRSWGAVKVKGILIAHTTRKERERIVTESIDNFEGIGRVFATRNGDTNA